MKRFPPDPRLARWQSAGPHPTVFIDLGVLVSQSRPWIVGPLLGHLIRGRARLDEADAAGMAVTVYVPDHCIYVCLNLLHALLGPSVRTLGPTEFSRRYRVCGGRGYPGLAAAIAFVLDREAASRRAAARPARLLAWCTQALRRLRHYVASAASRRDGREAGGHDGHRPRLVHFRDT